jgi:anti-anti-sigma regulatory factor
MTLRIDRHTLGKWVILKLIGSLRIEHIQELKAQIKAGSGDIVLDVGAITVIGVEGIRFLNSCQNEGIAITNASPYISEWMTLERDGGPK